MQSHLPLLLTTATLSSIARQSWCLQLARGRFFPPLSPASYSTLRVDSIVRTIYIPMPPIPPIPGGIPPMPPAPGSSGESAIIASVVIRRPDTEKASRRAVRTTLVGSMMPFWIMFTYSPVCALKPMSCVGCLRSSPTITLPSKPCDAIEWRGEEDEREEVGTGRDSSY